MQGLERISEVLETIVCPVCHGHLAINPMETSIVTPEQGTIRCLECRRSYPIEDGIPILLAARAILERESSMGEKGSDHSVSDGEREQDGNGDQREHECP